MRAFSDPAFPDHVADRIAALPGALAVTLGGSRAEGTHTPASDWVALQARRWVASTAGACSDSRTRPRLLGEATITATGASVGVTGIAIGRRIEGSASNSPPWQDARMELRPELLPRQVAPQLVEALGREIDRIAELRGDAAQQAMATFQETTGHDCSEFRDYWAAESREDAAMRAARPRHPRVPDITRDELVEIVRRVMTCRPPEQDWYLLVLETNTSHPAVSNLIFWPPPELEAASAEEIVDAILSYRPIAL